MGSVTIPLNNLERGVELVDWYNLTGVRSGQIQLGLTAVDFGGVCLNCIFILFVLYL